MNKNPPRLLIACVGNIFLGDDGFGVEIARRLGQIALPEDVRVVDFGIRGLDLTYALLDPYEAVILVDALPRGGPPGTLYVLEPDRPVIDPANAAGVSLIEGHGMDPVKVLRLVEALGGQVRRLLVVGCEPMPIGDADDFAPELSDPVQAALDEAITLIQSLAARLLAGEPIESIPIKSHPNHEVEPCRD